MKKETDKSELLPEGILKQAEEMIMQRKNWDNYGVWTQCPDLLALELSENSAMPLS